MDLRDAKEAPETPEERSQKNREAIKARMTKLGAVLQEDSLSGLLEMICSLMGDANASHLSDTFMTAASSMMGSKPAWRMEPVEIPSPINLEDAAIGVRMGWAYAVSSLARLKGWELPFEVYANVMGGDLEGLTVLTALYQSGTLEEGLNTAGVAAQPPHS